MEKQVRVTLAMPVADELVDRIRGLDPRLEVTVLTRAQRRMYREGRALWGGYAEPAAPEDESDEEARRSLDAVLATTEVLFCNPLAPADILTRARVLRWVQLTG